VKRIFPDYEMTLNLVRNHFENSIRTVVIKTEKKNLHELAMKSNNVMIAAFGDGTRNHSVLIDGRKGTITDPIASYGKVKRSDSGLQKLGITKFHTVHTLVRRREMGHKKRRNLQKKHNLPFTKGSAHEWED